MIDGFKRKIDTIEDRMRIPLTDMSVENIQTKAKGGKNGKYEGVRDIENSEKALNMYNWSPRGERENRAKAI